MAVRQAAPLCTVLQIVSSSFMSFLQYGAVFNRSFCKWFGTYVEKSKQPMSTVHFQPSDQAISILYLPMYVLCIYVFIYYLFKGIIAISDCRAIGTRGRVITGRMCKTELSIGMIWDNMPVFAWRDWGNPRKLLSLVSRSKFEPRTFLIRNWLLPTWPWRWVYLMNSFTKSKYLGGLAAETIALDDWTPPSCNSAPFTTSLSSFD